ncbi:hypothetical protein FJZ26_05385, partial [Candidatus Parvarchaeota archaeon]|nr:hypothetical protein [Candidatus Parvarchaeota archaeon]
MKQTALATPSSRMQVEGGAGKLDLRHIKPSAYNEFGKLKVVVVQKPTYLGEVWSNGLPINEWEAKSAAPKKDVALRQHEQMVNAMEKHGAQVIEIPAS